MGRGWMDVQIAPAPAARKGPPCRRNQSSWQSDPFWDAWNPVCTLRSMVAAPRSMMLALGICSLLQPATGQDLMRAIRDNNPSMVNMAVKMLHPDKLNAVDAEGDTPFLAAVRGGKHKAVKSLIKHVDTTVKDPAGMSAIQICADQGSQKTMLALLTAKLDVNEEGPDGLRPIHRAVLKGHTDTLKALLNAEVSAETPTADGKTPMELSEGLPEKEGARRVKAEIKEVLKKFARTKEEL